MRSDAVEELFKEHYNDAYLYTLTITKNAQEAEDIVSVAFFRALNTAYAATKYIRAAEEAEKRLRSKATSRTKPRAP